ncbi:Der1-like family-domain-containing protein [Mycena floridula]|nr:Der1-like family-domain-containing protein [Mycena floridula]
MDLVTEIRKIPVVTRCICLSFFVVSMAVFMNLFAPVHYHFQLVFYKFQIWRLYTSFFVGTRNIGYIFEMAMLYRAANEIESGPYSRKSADLAWQLFVACALIIVTSIPVQPGYGLFFRPLLHCLVYLSSALAPVGSTTSLYGLITIPVAYWPYVMLLFELLTGGPYLVAMCLPGTLVGHLWWWGVWGSDVGGRGGVLVELSRAPVWLAEYMGDTQPPPGAGPGAGRGANAGGGVTVIPPRHVQNQQATGGTYNWGSGNRLGN